MDVEIVRAGEGDLDAVLGVMDEAGAWLHSIGVTEQWPASFSEEPKWVEEFRGLIGRGAVFLALREGAAVGSVVLEEHPYSQPVEALWPDGALDAVLLGRLAVRRGVAGTGVAAHLMRWAAEHTRSRGKRELRLDCWAGNERLKRYYGEAGFESRGDAEVSISNLRQTRTTYFVSRFAIRVS